MRAAIGVGDGAGDLFEGGGYVPEREAWQGVVAPLWFEALVNTISENYKFDQLLKNFLSFLIKKRRFFFVERILKSFIEICSEKRGELKAELRSAKQLSNDEITQITEELTKNFSSKIKLNYKHDESLIGGLVVQVGSTMVDTSIKSKLQQIENRMIEA